VLKRIMLTTKQELHRPQIPLKGSKSPRLARATRGIAATSLPNRGATPRPHA
jgi:hypothetical protein